MYCTRRVSGITFIRYDRNRKIGQTHNIKSLRSKKKKKNKTTKKTAKKKKKTNKKTVDLKKLAKIGEGHLHLYAGVSRTVVLIINNNYII